MYYVTTTAKRKNAKRHIGLKATTIWEAIYNSKGFNVDRYTVELYNGKWQRMGIKESPTDWDITEYARAILAEAILTFRKYSDDSVVKCDTDCLYLLKGSKASIDNTNGFRGGFTNNHSVYCQIKHDKLLAVSGGRIQDDEV